MATKNPLINTNIQTLKNTKKWLVSVSLLLVLFSGFNFAEAAVLYFEPQNLQLKLGQEFKVKVKIDTEKECINTVKTEIEYNENYLIAKDFLTGNSIISLWLEKPKIEAGKITFSGGIPGGYCGKISGDPGESDILGEIIFKVPQFLVREIETTQIKFSENSKVLLNDGLGTEAKLNLEKSELQILKEKEISPEKILEEELKEDKIPPEPFGILVLKDPQIFGGKYFIVFHTQDKQTGIDHFEVKEGENPWEKADSPYLLRDQDLKSKILVKAVDKAGNERISEFKPSLPKTPPFIYWIIIIGVVLMGIGYWLYRKSKINHQKLK